jgi:outer membrane protein, heavy metal efflux system
MLFLLRRYGCGRATVMLLALVSASTIPQQSTAATGMILSEVMHEALIRNQDLEAARSQVNAAMGRLKQAGRWPNTRLDLSNQSNKVLSTGGEFTRSIGFSQNFPIAGRINRAMDVARVDVASALTEVNEAERTLLADVARAYYDIVAIDQQIALREKLVAIDQALVSASAARQKMGEVSEIDVNTASLELERLRQQQTVLSGKRAAVLKTLAGLSGFGVDEGLAVDTTLPAIVPPPPVQELRRQALSQRPDLRLLSLASNRARAEQSLAKASAWEDWTVSLGVERDKLVITGLPRQSTDTALLLRLSVPIPVLNRNRGAQSAAAADAMTAHYKRSALQMRIENEVTGRYAQVMRLLDALTAYRDRTLPLSSRTAELARKAYSMGQLSIADVVQAQRQEIDLNSSYADTLALYLQARADLKTATAGWTALMTHPVDTSADQTGGR